jgi:hypothetical protein
MSKLLVMRDRFVNKLRLQLKDNFQFYTQDASWVEEYASSAPWRLETALAYKGDLELLLPHDDQFEDLENAVRVHKALPDLTRLQARDPRLWTYLAHVNCWTYMRCRWDVGKSKDADAAMRYTLSHYFVSQNQSRALMRNGIARLWWFANLTYDSSRDNPYELTSVLFQSLDIAKNMLERNLGRAPCVLIGFLEFLLIHKELLTGGNANREAIRKLSRFLNLYGGVCLLDTLSKERIMYLLQHEYDRFSAGKSN